MIVKKRLPIIPRSINGWLRTSQKKALKKKALMPDEAPEKKLEDYIPAMLAKETDKPFSKEDWIYEIKWDGYRAIAEVNKKGVKLYSRNGNSFLSAYPEVA